MSELILPTPHQVLIGWIIFLLVWLYTQNIWLLDLIDESLDRIACQTSGRLEWFIRLIQTHFDCQKCVTFWLTLTITLNPLLALTLAWIANITSNKK